MAALTGTHEFDGVHYVKYFQPVILDRVKTFQFRPDDIVIANYQKSGGVMMCELVWLIMNNLDYRGASDSPVRQRVPIIEITVPNKAPNIERLEQTEGPRLLNTILYHHFFAKTMAATQPKVIVLLRNPKDVLVSFYHYCRMAMHTSYQGSWDEFFQLSKTKTLNTGDWFDHMTSWWNAGTKNEKYLFVKFEDFIRDPSRVIQTVADFCGRTLTADNIRALADHVAFESLARNPMTNMTSIPTYNHKISPFLRKGVVGDWKNYFSKEQDEVIEKMYNDRCKTLGLQMDFQLEPLKGSY